MTEFTPNEIMIIAAARELGNDDVCFVGIGAPSAASNLARLTHAPDITLIYESGTIGTKPDVLPLSIGDGELCETALTTVAVPEMFRYWLQGGKMTVGFLSAAQIDRYANINTTVIGSYANPKVRLPGGGGAPEIASHCQKIFIIMKQSQRGFVEQIDFMTSFGFGQGGDDRINHGIHTAGPTVIVTDFAVWRPHPATKEFQVSEMHPGVTREALQESIGWTANFRETVQITKPPTELELATLRDIMSRTEVAQAVQT